MTLQQNDWGPIYAQGKFKVSGNICDPRYRLKDGAAAFLERGTPIYQFNGQLPGSQTKERGS